MTERFTKGTEILKKENKCCICNSKDNLEPHHIFHTNKYDELHDSIENLVVMCHNCHHNYHQQYNQEITFRTLLEFQKEYWKEYCPKLKTMNKKLKKQNKQLKKANTNLHRAMSKNMANYFKFRDKVFDLLDIKETDTIGAEVLKDLRRELIE